MDAPNINHPRWMRVQNTPRLRRPYGVQHTTGNSPSDITISESDIALGDIVDVTDSAAHSEEKSILETSNLSVDAEEFVPAAMAKSFTQASSSEFRTETKSGGNRKEAVRSLKQFMEQVTMNPGCFDALLKNFLSDFKMWSGNIQILEKMAALIVDQSTMEANFRYSGARLCNCLRNECKKAGNNFFWDGLNAEWQKRKEEATKLLHESPQRVRGLLVFLAELFVQTEDNADYLCSDICHIISLILNDGTTENLKCVCQTLKLVGRSIDKVYPEKLDEIMSELSKINSNKSADQNICRQISTLLDLRSSNWGEFSADVQQELSSAASYVQDEPVLYGPDGNVLTAEERRFLEENSVSTDGVGALYEDEYGHVWDTQDPMDELDDAFEEFLKFSNQQ